MGLIDLFIVSDKPTEEPVKQSQPVKETKAPVTRFPTSEPEVKESSGLFNSFGFNKVETPKVETTFKSNPSVSQEQILNAVQIYQNGFDSLNQQGYDFYEFYQAILSAGVENQQVYPMALAMASAMDKTITKDKLVEQSRFYVAEIKKVYDDFVSKGNQKKQELTNQKNEENRLLVNDLNSFHEQMEMLKTQIADRERKISEIDGKYSPKIAEIDEKLMANDMAKDKIVKSIEQVQQGILNNIR